MQILVIDFFFFFKYLCVLKINKSLIVLERHEGESMTILIFNWRKKKKEVYPSMCRQSHGFRTTWGGINLVLEGLFHSKVMKYEWKQQKCEPDECFYCHQVYRSWTVQKHTGNNQFTGSERNHTYLTLPIINKPGDKSHWHFCLP